MTKNLLQKEYAGNVVVFSGVRVLVKLLTSNMVDPPEGVRANDAPANAFLKSVQNCTVLDISA
ncbi:MAG: hypothetical protein MJE68_27800 [Proteobacteria bacterium]|nr:hypothetical protein [Pseudomonadota bacterium]